jgi:pimeloyl-ACP methyl ester carboxylesterase
MPLSFNISRRRLLSLGGLALAAQLPDLARAREAAVPTAPAGFGTLRQIKAGLLDVGYAELGPGDGAPVILLHGWPYDIHSFAEVAPMLAAEGYRVIVPHLRGHGSTRFLSETTLRNGQQAAVALDIIALMDALKIPRAILAGFDWGARTADIIAALWPSTTPPSSAARPRSTIPTTSPSSSTTTAGAWAWRRAKRATTTSSAVSPPARRYRCRASRWTVTPTA